MKRLHPTVVYVLIRGLWALCEGMFFFLLPVYYIQNAGMNPLQLVLMGTVTQVTIFVFEVPTGVVADAYSRKLAVIIGMLTGGLCFALEGFVPVFACILLAEFLRAIGETCISGAFSAWITDEIGVERVGRVLMRGNQASQVTGIVSTGMGIGLSTFLPLGTHHQRWWVRGGTPGGLYDFCDGRRQFHAHQRKQTRAADPVRENRLAGGARAAPGPDDRGDGVSFRGVG